MTETQTEKSGEEENSTDNVLPFEVESPPRFGEGPLKHIVPISEYEDKARSQDHHPNTIMQGRCYRCGYDRGLLIRHTIMSGKALECEQCGQTLYVKGDFE